MNFWDFFQKSLLLLLACVLTGYLAIHYGAGRVSPAPLATGIGISFGNALLGFAILAWGFRRSHARFMLSVFGGMILRFLLIFSLLFVLIGALKMNQVILISSLMITYFLFMGLEIFQIQKCSDRKGSDQ